VGQSLLTKLLRGAQIDQDGVIAVVENAFDPRRRDDGRDTISRVIRKCVSAEQNDQPK
jgi:ABC-type siderophore export system fused ATPase/permease subunit